MPTLFHRSAALPLAIVIVLGAFTPAGASFITPQSWTRGDGGTTYQAWDFFTDPEGLPGNAPDVASINLNGTANLVQNATGAFVTGGGNIYSFSVATDFTVTVPEADVPAPPHNVTAIVQFRTLGTELDYASVLLNGLAPVNSVELERIDLGGFGGAQVDQWFLFNVPYASFGSGSGGVSDLTLIFQASGSSMSLDQLAIDTAIRPFGYYDEPTPVPEPASLGLLVLSCLGAFRRR